ncbi:hypothetical protein IAT40_004018 [Kwoniella sp. CBS 6097]
MSAMPSSSTAPLNGGSSASSSPSTVYRQQHQQQQHQQQQQQFFIPFDPESPLFVAKGVISTGALGALTGASIGVVRNQNPFALSINMTINLSVAGLTFFSIREYLVSPLLLSIDLTPSHTRRYNDLLHLSEKQFGKLPSTSIPTTTTTTTTTSSQSQSQSRSLTEVRLDRVADSALAGALTGGILSAAFRGRATFGKAALTSSLIASTLQLGVNQLRVFRLKALAKHSDVDANIDANIDVDVSAKPAQQSTHEVGTSSSSSSIRQGENNINVSSQPPQPLSTSSAGLNLGSSTEQTGRGETVTIFQSFEDPLKAHDPLHNPSFNSNSSSNSNPDRKGASTLAPSFPERMMTSLSKFLPVRKLSDDEYIATLEKKRADVDKRLREIDEEEKRMYAWAEAQGQKR